jgi:hypothetical protein
MFSRYFGRFLLLVGLLFFIFSLTIFAFLFLHPQGTWSPAVLPTHLNPRLAGGGSTCTQVGDLVIDKYWPNQIDLNSSDTIRADDRIRWQ